MKLNPSVAECPTSGPDQQAFDGGAIITPSDTTNDVVGIEDAFPGHYVNQTEVDPLPLPTPTPGGVSLEPADAYEVQAVIESVSSGSLITVQSYVEWGRDRGSQSNAASSAGEVTGAWQMKCSHT